MKTQYCFLVLLLLAQSVSSQMWCTWTLQSANSSNSLAEYGLRLTSKKCLWNSAESQPQISLYLYNQLFRDYVSMKIYFDYSLTSEDNFYNKTANIAFPQCQENTSKNDTRSCNIQPHVHLCNNKLTITLNNEETLALQLSQNQVQNQFKLLMISLIYMILNLQWATTLSNLEIEGKPSIYLIIANLGWVGFLFVQFSKTLFYYKPSQFNAYGRIKTYLILEAAALGRLYLIQHKIKMPKFQMRFLVILACLNICQLLLSKETNYILFTLIPSIQIIDNIVNKRICSISPLSQIAYTVNILFILYMLESSNYLQYEVIPILALLQMQVLACQQKMGPYLGFEKSTIYLNILGGKKIADQIEIKNKGNHLNQQDDSQQNDIAIAKKDLTSMIEAAMLEENE